MKHKIVKVNSVVCEEVSLNIMRDEEEGTDYVEITAWHYNADEDLHHFQIECINLPSFDMCAQFIEDFTEKAAVTFIKQFHF
jgi:uncharacterized protein YrzB (UPF0473 family)